MPSRASSVWRVRTPALEVSMRTFGKRLGADPGEAEELAEERRVAPPRREPGARALGAAGPRLDRPVALRLDLGLHLELEARIVRLVVAGAADLQDHARVALVAEREDRADAACALLHVVSARAVAGLAADAREVGVRRGRRVAREASRAVEARRVAAQAACFGRL